MERQSHYSLLRSMLNAPSLPASLARRGGGISSTSASAARDRTYRTVAPRPRGQTPSSTRRSFMPLPLPPRSRKESAVLPALVLAALALLVWNIRLVAVIASSGGDVERGARVTLGAAVLGAPRTVDVSAIERNLLSPRSGIPPRPPMSRAAVQAELRATHSWVRALVASNRRLIRGMQSTTLPSGTTDASRATFRPLLHRAEATLRSSIAIDVMLARTEEGNAASGARGGDPTALLLTPAPRIFCAIPTAWPRDEFRVVALEKTWGRHCDFLKFAVSQREYDSYHLAQRDDSNKFLVVDMINDIDPTKRNIWEKSWKMWLLISKRFGDVADFYVKTDADAFLMVENLRGFVRHLDASTPHYLGHTMMQRWGTENIKFNVGAGCVCVIHWRTLCVIRESARGCAAAERASVREASERHAHPSAQLTN